MKSSTKITNYLLRGAILAALITAVLSLTSAGKILSDAVSGVTEENVEAFLEKLAGVNLMASASKAKIAVYILAAAVILSIIAFKASSGVASVFRTIFLAISAGIAFLSSVSMSAADLTSRYMAGSATAAELEDIKPLVDAVAKEGQSEGVITAGLLMLGCVGLLLVIAVLVILTITSIVSVIKTTKAETI